MNKLAFRGPARQSGSSAVEFALVFPLLFGMTYAIVVYSFFFIVNQSLNFAAQTAAEATVAIDPQQNQAAYRANVVTAVTNSINSNMRFLNDDVRALLTIPAPIFCGSGGGDPACPADGTEAVVVKVSLNTNSGNRLFARMDLPFLGQFPPIPTLRAQAVARL